MDYSKILATLKPLVTEQGNLLRDTFYNLDKTDLNLKYKDNVDFATKLDEEIEEKLYTTLQAQYPEIGFNMEEHVDLNKDSEFTWYIDPIDGTKYFAKGIPLFSISIGLLKEGNPVLGLVYNPITEQMYEASETAPSTLNGKRISVSQTDSIVNSINYVTITHHKLPGHNDHWDEDKDWVTKKLGELVQSCYRIRMVGLSSLEYAWVATGALDASVLLCAKDDIKYLDHAAGHALVKYAGGKLLELEIPGLKSPRFILGNPKIVDDIAGILLKQ